MIEKEENVFVNGKASTKKLGNFYSNHDVDDANSFSVAARVLASRNIGVTLIDRAVDAFGNVIPDWFAEYVTPEALPIRHRVGGSAEVLALYDIYMFREIPERLKASDLSHINPEERIAAARLLVEAKLAQYRADLMFKTNPIEAIKYDVRAISARMQAKWILEKLPSIVSIIEQVVDRELVS